MKKLYRNLIDFLVRSENDSRESNPTSYGQTVIGEVKAKVKDKEVVVALQVTDTESITSASVIWTPEGTCSIVIPFSELISLLSVDFTLAMFGILAHEVGHIISGHSTVDKSSYFVNHDRVKQESLYLKCYPEYDDRTVNTYMRSAVTAILHGGVLELELEADMNALQLVDLPALIAAHTFDLHTHTNPTTIIEKVNRINKLVKYCKETDIDRTGNTFSFTFNNEVFTYR